MVCGRRTTHAPSQQTFYRFFKERQQNTDINHHVKIETYSAYSALYTPIHRYTNTYRRISKDMGRETGTPLPANVKLLDSLGRPDWSAADCEDVAGCGVWQGPIVDVPVDPLNDPFCSLLAKPARAAPRIKSPFWGSLAQLVYYMYGDQFHWAWAHTVAYVNAKPTPHDESLRRGGALHRGGALLLGGHVDNSVVSSGMVHPNGTPDITPHFADPSHGVSITGAQQHIAVLNVGMIGMSTYVEWVTSFWSWYTAELTWRTWGRYAQRVTRAIGMRTRDLEDALQDIHRVERRYTPYVPQRDLCIVGDRVLERQLSTKTDPVQLSGHVVTGVYHSMPPETSRRITALYEEGRMEAIIQCAVRSMYGNENSLGSIVILATVDVELHQQLMRVMGREGAALSATPGCTTLLRGKTLVIRRDIVQTIDGVRVTIPSYRIAILVYRLSFKLDLKTVLELAAMTVYGIYSNDTDIVDDSIKAAVNTAHHATPRTNHHTRRDDHGKTAACGNSTNAKTKGVVGHRGTCPIVSPEDGAILEAKVLRVASIIAGHTYCVMRDGYLDWFGRISEDEYNGLRKTVYATRKGLVGVRRAKEENERVGLVRFYDNTMVYCFRRSIRRRLNPEEWFMFSHNVVTNIEDVL